jgi:Ig-like domain-containing protein
VYVAHVTSPRESTRFSDNFVDLLPDETREIVAVDESGAIGAGDLNLGWA